jgi:hypothetical protein
METPLPSGFKKKYGSNIFLGLPYEGVVFDRKETDPDSKQPVLVEHVSIKQFLSTEEKDMKEWQEIMQKVADGVSIISFEEKVYDEKIGGWRILIRWMDMKYTNPEGIK